MIHKNPRGHSVVSAIAAVVVVVVAVGLGVVGVGLLAGLNAIDCHINVFWGCPSDGGGGGAAGPGAAGTTLCTSLPNACGMTNNGVLSSCSIGSSNCVNGQTCSATTPPNSSCPAPQIPVGTGFYAKPDLVEAGSNTTLYWATTNTTSCTVTGGPLANGSNTFTGTGSGNISTGAINAATIYTLTCEDGAGGPQVSASLRINIIPKYKEL